MTLLAVPIMVQSIDSALAAAARAAELGADLVEFRIDQVADQPHELPRLVERSALPCIITCRPTWEGGLYDGDEQTRIAALEHACLGARQPAYLDVELAAYQRSANLRQKIGLVVDHPGQLSAAGAEGGGRPTSTGLILSSHDFDSRPADLYQRLEAMAAAPACRVIKLVWRARSLRDNLEAFEIIAQRHKPTIALCMGDEGLASRLLAKKFGALLTFASLDDAAGTAPGQPTVRQIKDLYRWDAIGPQTRVYGVIGWPIGHSMSPAVHNAAFAHTGFDGVYLPMPIPPAWEAFKATVTTWLEMKGLDFRGVSVTIPHKENLLRFVKERGGEIEPLAQIIGAANTLVVRDDAEGSGASGGLYAANTDYAAALDAVCAGLHIERKGLTGLRIAVLGAGGAARAIVAGFAHYGATVVIYNRTPEKAQALAEQFAAAPTLSGKPAKIVAARMEKLCDSCCQVYINCTPIGMHPNVDETPFTPGPSGPDQKEKTIVFDTIYNPPQTRLLREARAAGCLTIPGTEMFTRQAAAQFKLWTRLDAPLDVFDRVLAERLAAQGR